MMRPQPRKDSGVALLLVILSLALLTVLSYEIMLSSRVDLKIGRNAKERLQSYYLAQSALRFSMLRLHLFKTVRNMVDSGGAPIPGLNAQMADMIWSFPLPNLPLPGMDKVVWPGQMSASIESEGSKIPINLIDGDDKRGSSKEMAESVKKQVQQLIEGLLEDEEFDKTYRGLKPADLIEPLEDWIDADSEKKSGGDELQYYERQNPPYRPRNDRIPSISELYMIENWTDDLVKRLGRHFTVLNTTGKINPNYVSLERLKIFEPKLSQEDLGIIQRRRMEQPFKDLEDLKNFIRTSSDIKGGTQFDYPAGTQNSSRETIFYLKASGIVGDVRKDMRVAVRFTEEAAKASTAGNTKVDADSGTGSDAGAGTENKNGNNTKPGKLLDPQVILVEETT